MPLKPKPLTLKKHVVPPPPPPPPLPTQSPPTETPTPYEDVKDESLLQLSSEHVDEQTTPTPPPPPPLNDEDDDEPQTAVDSFDESPPTPPVPEELAMMMVNDDAAAGGEQGAVAAAVSTDVPEATPMPLEGVARRLRKGNLKSGITDALRKSRRVSFDPLALLLDASLEGELELVKKTALEVCACVGIYSTNSTSQRLFVCACVPFFNVFLVSFFFLTVSGDESERGQRRRHHGTAQRHLRGPLGDSTFPGGTRL